MTADTTPDKPVDMRTTDLPPAAASALSRRGRAFVFGDNIDTDLLAPGPYMRESPDVLASHCLEAIDPDFASDVQRGDIVVGGKSFGIGSSREQAVQSLVVLGVGAIVATSFARIFYRNALNFGLPALTCPDLQAERGDDVEVRPQEGLVINHTTGKQYQCESIPPELMEIVNVGGLMPWLARKLAPDAKAAAAGGDASPGDPG
ncbi:LeuD/DmdB family oxidoreductase small subunit [Novilysobacter ciconiae]|nr:3-isopropylmalate dehydratase small subunit [Lysobacter ciconiae]